MRSSGSDIQWQQAGSRPPRTHRSRLGASAAAASGLLAPLVLVGNGDPSSALNSPGDGRLRQLRLQAPPAAGLQEGGWEEREGELSLRAGRWHYLTLGLSPTQLHHEPAGLISARARVWFRQARVVLGGGWGARRSLGWVFRISPVISEMSGTASAAGMAGGSSTCAQAPAEKW